MEDLIGRFDAMVIDHNGIGNRNIGGVQPGAAIAQGGPVNIPVAANRLIQRSDGSSSEEEEEFLNGGRHQQRRSGDGRARYGRHNNGYEQAVGGGYQRNY